MIRISDISVRRDETSGLTVESLQTYIKYADNQADLIGNLFRSTGSNVFSEYNSPTYYGMDVWALAGAIKYAPPNANVVKNSKAMLTDLWADIAAHYNPYLSVMAGPVCLPYQIPVNSVIAVADSRECIVVRSCLHSRHGHSLCRA